MTPPTRPQPSLDPDPLWAVPQMVLTPPRRIPPFATFAVTLALGAVAGIALGGNIVTSGCLWLALVGTFRLGQLVGREEGVAPA